MRIRRDPRVGSNLDRLARSGRTDHVLRQLVSGGDLYHGLLDRDHNSQHTHSPLLPARRSTSATVSGGAPRRRGKTGTPRSKLTSASAIRRSSASTNSSTGCPVSPARSASRSFSAASTAIVAFGMCPLSHDEPPKLDARSRLMATRSNASPLGWAQIWAHQFSNAANNSRISTFGGRPSFGAGVTRLCTQALARCLAL